MTTAQIIKRVRGLLAYDLDLTPSVDGDGVVSDATDADVVEAINDAMARMGGLAPIFRPRIPFTITTDPEYDLTRAAVCPARVVRIMDVVIAGRMLRTARGTKAGPWALTELEDAYPTWRVDAPGAPLRWCKLDDRRIILNPSPDAETVGGGGCYLSALCLPAPLSDTAPEVEPELAYELHEHIARLAAAISAEAVATNRDQMAKIAGWKNDAIGNALRIGSKDERARSSIGTTSGRSRPDFFRV